MPENSDYTWFLLSRHLSGETDPAEIAAFQKWLAEDPNHQQQYELMKQLWQAKSHDPQPAVDASKINRILQLATVEEALQEKNEWIPTPSRIRKIASWKIATTLVALALCAWAALRWVTNADMAQKTHRIVTQKGSRTRSILPDGSVVWLNAASSVSYNESFDQNRDLTLVGEAFFDVADLHGRSFTVRVGNVRVIATGGAFNLVFYPGDTVMEATVIEGRAQVTGNDEKHPVFLQAYQKIILPSSEKRSGSQLQKLVTAIDTSLKENERRETAWIFNRLQFQNDDFSTLAKKLERWYNIHILFEDEKTKKLVFSGSVGTGSVEQALKTLQATSPFQYRVSGAEIRIRSSE